MDFVNGDPSYDVIVVGARCAGAAAALLLARRGLRVLVVDKSRHGSDTLSTHALMRGGVLQLHRWGLLGAVRAAGTPPVSSTTFHYAEEPVEVTIKPRDGVDALYAPRRTVLDPILANAAAEAGAEILRGPRVVDLLRSSHGRVDGVVLEGPAGRLRRLRAGLVIGADGVRSTVARLVGAPIVRQAQHSTALFYGYWKDLGAPGYHWYFRPGASAGTIATNDATLCFAAVPQDRFHDDAGAALETRFIRMLQAGAPELVERVRQSRPVGGLRGYAGQAGFLRRSWGPGWALVGDAGYFKDPATAHGITDALRDAELIARAVETGTDEALAEYQWIRDTLSTRFFELTDAIASFDWDFEKLQQLHREMSDEMRDEVQYLSGLVAAQPQSRDLVQRVS